MNKGRREICCKSYWFRAQCFLTLFLQCQTLKHYIDMLTNFKPFYHFSLPSLSHYLLLEFIASSQRMLLTLPSLMKILF